MSRERLLLRAEGFISDKNTSREVLIYGPRYSKYGNTIIIPSISYIKKLRGRNKFNIFKLDICDLDGDGIEEINFGVYKKSPHHRVMAKRVFAYNFEEKLVPKYRCSRFSKPLLDYFIKEKDRSEIYCLLRTRTGKTVEVYRYTDFSYERIKTFDLDTYEDIKLEDNKIFVKNLGRWEIYNEEDFY